MHCLARHVSVRAEAGATRATRTDGLADVARREHQHILAVLELVQLREQRIDDAQRV